MAQVLLSACQGLPLISQLSLQTGMDSLQRRPLYNPLVFACVAVPAYCQLMPTSAWTLLAVKSYLPAESSYTRVLNLA